MRACDIAFSSPFASRDSPAGKRCRVRSPSARSQMAACRSATTRLNGFQRAASSCMTAAAASMAESCSSASRGSSPRVRNPGASGSGVGRLRSIATTPASLTASQVPPRSRSIPPRTPGRSGQWHAGGFHVRATSSSRLAPMITGQRWSGRRSRTSVHIRADPGWQAAEIVANASFRFTGRVGEPGSGCRHCGPRDGPRLPSPLSLGIDSGGR